MDRTSHFECPSHVPHPGREPGLLEKPDIDISATPATVWAVLTGPEHIRVWWAFGGADVDLRPGGSMLFRWPEHGEYHSVIEAAEPAKRFTFRMSATPGEQPGPRNETLVGFTLSPVGDGTRLRFSESGFAGLNGSAAENAQHAAISKQGWTGGLDTLKAIAEKLTAEPDPPGSAGGARSGGPGRKAVPRSASGPSADHG